MELNEHKVARNVAKSEVLAMIEDFKNGTPKLMPSAWGEGGKNYTFAKEFLNKTGRELTDKVIKHNIISELTFNSFVDVIYPSWCKTEKDCVDAIKQNHLYWVFHLEMIEVSNVHGNDVNLGDLYVKLEPLSGEFYIVKSLHTPDYLDTDGEFTERDLQFIHLYDDIVNGRR